MTSVRWFQTRSPSIVFEDPKRQCDCVCKRFMKITNYGYKKTSPAMCLLICFRTKQTVAHVNIKVKQSKLQYKILKIVNKMINELL